MGQTNGSTTRTSCITEGVRSALFAGVVSGAPSIDRTSSVASMSSGHLHDAHNVDIMLMSCKLSFISQDGCPKRNPMTYNCLMRGPP